MEIVLATLEEASLFRQSVHNLRKKQFVETFLPAFSDLRGKALPPIVILRRLLQPGGTNPVLLFIDGVCLSDIGSEGRYLLGNGLSFRFRNQQTLLKVRRLGIAIFIDILLPPLRSTYQEVLHMTAARTPSPPPS